MVSPVVVNTYDGAVGSPYSSVMRNNAPVVPSPLAANGKRLGEMFDDEDK